MGDSVSMGEQNTDQTVQSEIYLESQTLRKPRATNLGNMRGTKPDGPNRWGREAPDHWQMSKESCVVTKTAHPGYQSMCTGPRQGPLGLMSAGQCPNVVDLKVEMVI